MLLVNRGLCGSALYYVPYSLKLEVSRNPQKVVSNILVVDRCNLAPERRGCFIPAKVNMRHTSCLASHSMHMDAIPVLRPLGLGRRVHVKVEVLTVDRH